MTLPTRTWEDLWPQRWWFKDIARIANEFKVDYPALNAAIVDAWYPYQDAYLPNKDDSLGDDLDSVARLLKQVDDLLENPTNGVRLRTGLHLNRTGLDVDDLRACLQRAAEAARRAHRPRGGGQRRDAALAKLVHDLADFWRSTHAGEFHVGEWQRGVPMKAGGGLFVWECVKIVDPKHRRGLKNILQDEAGLTGTTPNKL
jgi:hypothetical protein